MRNPTKHLELFIFQLSRISRNLFSLAQLFQRGGSLPRASRTNKLHRSGGASEQLGLGETKQQKHLPRQSNIRPHTYQRKHDLSPPSEGQRSCKWKTAFSATRTPQMVQGMQPLTSSSSLLSRGSAKVDVFLNKLTKNSNNNDSRGSSRTPQLGDRA